MMRISLSLLVSILLFMASCGKKADAVPGTAEANLRTASFNEAYRLDEFLAYNFRHKLFYNNDGQVDSVRSFTSAISFTQHVRYRNNQIDSVFILSNGRLTEANYDFVYDILGRLTQFTYQDFYFGDPPVTTVINYVNATNTIKSIVKGRPEDWTYWNDSLQLNGKGEVTYRWSTFAGSPTETSSYTSDDSPNPLAMVPNLQFMLLSHGYIQEYFNSKSNFTTKSYHSFPFEVKFTNTYDANGRITKSVFRELRQGWDDSLVFKYAR